MLNACGPLNAKILIVGDIPKSIDMLRGVPFSDNLGDELNKMLSEAGIDPSHCRFTSLFKTLPMGGKADSVFDFTKKIPIGNTVPNLVTALHNEIRECNPNVVILLGGLSLYAANGNSAISTWRGSLLDIAGYKAIPTYSPAQIQTNWEWRGIAVSDLRRAAKQSLNRNVPQAPYRFDIRPTADRVLEVLGALTARADRSPEPISISADLETRGGHMACTGIAWSKYDAMCIPQMCVERPRGYFEAETELAIVLATRKLLTHPNVEVVGQNFLYDAQYFSKENGYIPRIKHDTMFQQHILFPGLPKGLDFLASMYCEHYTYWKGEGKEWNPKMPEEQLWGYNCKDACYTWEINEALKPLIAETFAEQYAFQMELWHATLRMMLRGVRIDMLYRKELTEQLLGEMQTRNQRLTKLVGHELNPRSPKQLQKFFYDDLGLPVQRQRKGKRGVTCDDEALTKLGRIEPLIRPVTNTIRELRSLNVFYANFVCAQLGLDNRIRCSFNPAGTETYRFNSSKDAFGEGTNLQNVPSGDEEEDHEADGLVLPNIRKLFVPDFEKFIGDTDLAGADAQVVAYESEDDILKDIFRRGEKLHAVNAKDMFGGNAGPDGKRMPYYAYAKAGCHLTNYGGKAATLSKATGMSMKESEAFQRRWFDIHPGIKRWHEETENHLMTRRYVENKFGYRRFYFDRIEGILPQALAWIPQSTVACVTNRALLKIHQTLPEIDILIQVHDSIVFQAPKHHWARLKPLLREALVVVVPYEDKLIIPFSLKTSPLSWGHCEDEKW